VRWRGSITDNQYQNGPEPLLTPTGPCQHMPGRWASVWHQSNQSPAPQGRFESATFSGHVCPFVEAANTAVLPFVGPHVCTRRARPEMGNFFRSSAGPLIGFCFSSHPCAERNWAFRVPDTFGRHYEAGTPGDRRQCPGRAQAGADRVDERDEPEQDG